MAAAAKGVVVTSQSAPMRVSWMTGTGAGGPAAGAAGGGPCGRLGLCHCPGKRLKKPRPRAGHEEARGPIMRDLAEDLGQLATLHGISTIICLLNDYELRSIGVDSKAYPAAAREAGVGFFQYPIIEGTAPTDVASTHRVIVQAHEDVRRGGRAAVHCRGGVGRAGMFAACYLIHTGECRTAKQAIAAVRKLRCKQAVETRRQEDFVLAYSTWHKSEAAALSAKPCPGSALA